MARFDRFPENAPMTTEKQRGRGLNPPAFVGRHRELEALDAAWDRAIRFNAPQIVTVVGALGIGKTRLVQEWLASEKVAAGGPGGLLPRIISVAAPDPSEGEEQQSLALIARMLRQRFALEAASAPGGGGFSHPEPVIASAEQALVEYRSELQRVFGDRRVADVAWLLGRFLGFELPDSPLSQALLAKPDQLADLQRAVLCRFLEQDSSLQPLVIVFDSLQFADDQSLELIGRLGAELGEARIVIITTARPDLQVRKPDWNRGQGAQTRLELGPLAGAEVDAMIRSILGSQKLAPGLVERAAAESVGNPFLIEELIRVYDQHGILVAETGESWWFDFDRASRESMALTAEESAQNRIAGLTPSERDLLARGGVFGPTFWLGAVVALARIDAEPADATAVFAPDPAIQEMRRMLDSLAERGFLTRAASSSIPGDTQYKFRNKREMELVSAGVGSTVMRRRKRFAGQWFESRFQGTVSEVRWETLGRLYEEGGDTRRAAFCFLSGAQLARTHLAMERARNLYLRGIPLLEVDDSLVKMDALHQLGDVTVRLGRTHDAVAPFAEMLRIAWKLDLPAKGGAAHGRIGRLYRRLGEHKRALQHLELAKQLFELAGDLPGIASTLDDIGRVHLVTGNPDASLEHHKAALVVRERLGDERGKAMALARMGQAERESGRLVDASLHFSQALELRRQAGDREGVVDSLHDLGALERDLGNVDRALAILEEGRTLARELGEKLHECVLGIEIGECRLGAGVPREARTEFERARDIARQLGARRLLSAAARGSAESDLALGKPVDARDGARAAFEIAEKIGSPVLSGAALRVVAAAVGLGAPGEGDLGGAREMFDRAVEVLGDAGAELELGRTLDAYADFEERLGRVDTAKELRAQSQQIRERSRSRPAPGDSRWGYTGG